MFKPFQKMIDSALNTAHSVVNPDKVKKEIIKVFKQGRKKGEFCFLAPLENNLRIRPGFVYCFTGYPASGKSEFVNFLCMLQAENNGRKTVFYSPENYPVVEMAETLIQSHLGKWVYDGEDQCTLEELTEGLEFITEHFTFLEYEDVPRIDELLNEFRIQSIENQIFVIDPFNSIAEGGYSDGNLSKYLRTALTQIKIFAYQTNSIVFLIEHPKGVISGMDNPPEASPYTLYGGSMWFNKMDVITALTRLEGDQVQVKVWKVKNQKLNGRPNVNEPATLKFNYRSNRYEIPSINEF